MQGADRKTDGSYQKPIHNFKDHARTAKTEREFHMRNQNLTAPLFHRAFGGGGRNRTDDLLLAKQMLSQLSYAPDKWWAWEDLNFRPHAYQACALAS